jgi:carbohydrate-binding DOMON domain-containing protein
MSLMSPGSRNVDEIGDIVDEWLVGEIGEEHAPLARTAARMYADFLMRHVDLSGVTAWPRGRVDAAFQQWRAQSEGGNA